VLSSSVVEIRVRVQYALKHDFVLGSSLVNLHGRGHVNSIVVKSRVAVRTSKSEKVSWTSP
jgi:hypothetical protein